MSFRVLLRWSVGRGLDKKVLKERERERERDDNEEEEEKEDDLVVFFRAMPGNGAHARLVAREKETTKWNGMEAVDDTQSENER